MKILLIEPKIEHGIVTHKHRNNPISKMFGNPSLTLSMVAAATPQEHSIRIINENYEKLNLQENYDIVGISVLTINAFRAYELADYYRKKGLIVVLGGYHVSALPEEGKQHADTSFRLQRKKSNK